MSYLSVDELKAMRGSSQLIRTERLKTILDNFGFSRRTSNTGTWIWHTEHPEIAPFNLVSGTDNLRSQLDAIDACLQAIELEATKEDHILEPTAPEAGATKAFTTTAQVDAFVIPDHFELVDSRRHPGPYLRHKKFPQIATTIKGYEPGADISTYCEYLDNRATDLEEVITRAEEDHDFEVYRYPNGLLVVTHTAHPITVALAPFTPRLENFTSIKLVEQAITIAEDNKADYNKGIEGVINGHTAEEIDSPDGKSRHFTVNNPMNLNKPFDVSIAVTTNGHVSYSGFVGLLEDIKTGIWGNFRKDVKRNYGFVVSKTTDGKLHGTHPVNDVEFTIEDPMADKITTEELERFSGLNSEDRDEMDQRLFEQAKTRTESAATVREAIHDCIREMTPRINRFEELRIHITTKFSTNPVEGEMGYITAQQVGKPSVQIPVQFLRTDRAAGATNVIEKLKAEADTAPIFKVVPTPEGLEQLEAYVEIHDFTRRFDPQLPEPEDAIGQALLRQSQTPVDPILANLSKPK